MTVHGVGSARLVFGWRRPRTVLTECFTRAPLHASQLLTKSAGEAHVALLTSGGGLLDGDQVQIDLHCDTGARATITAVGATRLLPAMTACTQLVRLELASASSLTYLPEPLIPCAGALYDQRLHVDAEAGATAAIGEIISPGRLGAGECFAYRRLTLATRIHYGGRLALVDRIVLEPDAGHLGAMLGSCTHLAGLILLGPAATKEMAAALHGMVVDSTYPAGVTLAAEHVIVVRALGHGVEPLKHVLAAIVQRFMTCRVDVPPSPAT